MSYTLVHRNYTVHRYCREWAIYDPVSRCYVAFSTSRKKLERLAYELNRKG